jgi:hypothetical protein
MSLHIFAFAAYRFCFESYVFLSKKEIFRGEIYSGNQNLYKKDRIRQSLVSWSWVRKRTHGYSAWL